jgi:hypothetical protein
VGIPKFPRREELGVRGVERVTRGKIRLSAASARIPEKRQPTTDDRRGQRAEQDDTIRTDVCRDHSPIRLPVDSSSVGVETRDRLPALERLWRVCQAKQLGLLVGHSISPA